MRFSLFLHLLRRPALPQPSLPQPPHLCFFHARKEAQSLAAEVLGHDLEYFFSGKYLSARDLIAVAEGNVKPRTTRAFAYPAQTLYQTIQLSQHEFTNPLGGELWHAIVRNSVTSNWNRIHPAPSQPHPAPEGASEPEAQVAADTQIAT